MNFNALKAATALTIALGLTSANAATGDKIRITNEKGQPIAGADVLVGNEPGKPFANNLLHTDVNGNITVTADWKTALPLTVTASGYLRATFLNVAPAPAEFQLHTADVPTQIEIKGRATQFGDLRKDGKVDFGLVYPALNRRQLAQFEIENVISPQFDQIKVLTETVSVPSNLTLPRQDESYILPITLEKPEYRLYVKDPGTYRVMATHGQFPLKQVVSQLRDGKSFYEVLNLFKFSECGQRDIVVNDKTSDQDVPINQVAFTRTVPIKAPTLDAGQVMLSAALTSQGDLYFPSDIKRIESGEQAQLAAPVASGNNYLVSLLMPQKEAEKIGGVHTTIVPAPEDPTQHISADFKIVFERFAQLFGLFIPADQGESAKPSDQPKFDANDGPGGMSIALNNESDSQPTFLSLIARPTVVSKTAVSMTAPAEIKGIQPVATYVVLSQIDHVAMGDYQLERRYRLWEVYYPGWVNQVQLPNLGLTFEPGKTYRWEVFYMGSTQTNFSDNAKIYFLDKVTHVSHNSFDIQ